MYDKIKVKVWRETISSLTYRVIACTVQRLQLQHSSEEAFQLSHRKIIWKFTLVSFHLSLLAELPVDSCTSSSSLIKKKLGRPTALSVQCKLYSRKSHTTWNWQMIKTKKINVERFSLCEEVWLHDVCKYLCACSCILCVFLFSVTQYVCVCVWYHRTEEHKFDKERFLANNDSFLYRAPLLPCTFWSRANCSFFFYHKSRIANWKQIH